MMDLLRLRITTPQVIALLAISLLSLAGCESSDYGTADSNNGNAYQGIFVSQDENRILVITNNEITMQGTTAGEPFTFVGTCQVNNGMVQSQGNFSSTYGSNTCNFYGHQSGASFVFANEPWRQQ
ncbi:MAG: hypothetical protein AB8B55_22505 [Mariniblastus sp.]